MRGQAPKVAKQDKKKKPKGRAGKRITVSCREGGDGGGEGVVGVFKGATGGESAKKKPNEAGMTMRRGESGFFALLFFLGLMIPV